MRELDVEAREGVYSSFVLVQSVRLKTLVSANNAVIAIFTEAGVRGSFS